MKNTEIVLPPKLAEIPVVGKLANNEIETYIKEAKKLLSEAGTDSKLQAEAITDICMKMVHFDNKLKVSLYIDELAKDFKIKRPAFNLALKEASKLLVDDSNGEIGDDNTPLINRVEKFISSLYNIFFNLIANKFMYKEIGDTEYKEMNIDNIHRQLKKHHLSYSLSDLKSLLKSDFTIKVNVFTKYFESLEKWDGTDHIGLLTEYVKVQEITEKSIETERFKRMFKKMLVRMVACSLEAGFNKQVFVLVHEKQNSGKSTFWRWMCPPELAEYYTESIGTSKDDLIALTENFILNIDELSTLSKIDLNALKSVISKDRLKIRLPYAERPEMLKRRGNFVASTNRLEFLNDETGSVRWVCFLLEYINWDYKKDIDINKIWGQAYHLFKNTDFDYQLSTSEIAENEEANKAFLIRSPEMELIQKYLIPSTRQEFEKEDYEEPVKFMTATDIITLIQFKNAGSIKLYSSNVGKALSMLGFIRDTKYFTDKEMSLKGYYLKEKDL